MKNKLSQKTKRCMKIYERILNTKYSYTNNNSSLSVEENILIELVYKSVKDTEAEISRKDLKAIWKKIKIRIKKSLMIGGVNIKMLQVKVKWTEYHEYFSILTCKATGIFKKLLDIYVRDFKDMPTEDNIEIIKKKFNNWIEL